jgi:hypothetical protein
MITVVVEGAVRVGDTQRCINLVIMDDCGFYLMVFIEYGDDI